VKHDTSAQDLSDGQVKPNLILGGTQPTLGRLGLWHASGRRPRRRRTCRSGRARLADGERRRVGAASDKPSAAQARIDPMLQQIAPRRRGSADGAGRRRKPRGQRASPGSPGGDSRRRGGGDPGSSRRRRRRHRSTVAELARVPADTAPNERFFFCAYYRGVVAGGRRTCGSCIPTWSSPFPRTTGLRWSASSR